MKTTNAASNALGALLTLLPFLAGDRPAALVASASPLPEVVPAGTDGSQGPPPMWNIRCPRALQNLCTPDNRLFYCTVTGDLYNQLSASCSACVCRQAGVELAAEAKFA